uniref:Tetratricopeptide repeat protein 36 n=1 Tax=Leptobrachium leishanense TaxID=445787 RepID=A0A8C5Q7G2_9ANUR
MCTPNDSAVLHAIFNPNSPFGDCEEQNVDNTDWELEVLNIPPELLKQVQTLERQGVEAAESGEIGTAVQRFNEAILLLPEWASTYNNRAQALRLQGDVAGALQDLNRAVELSEGKGLVGRQALIQRGLIFLLQKDHDTAKKDLRKAAQHGSVFAKQLLIQLNPYAALCNSMLRDMMQKLCEPDTMSC